MDPFDKKINKMRIDISKIDKEIKEIQKVSLSKKILNLSNRKIEL